MCIHSATAADVHWYRQEQRYYYILRPPLRFLAPPRQNALQIYNNILQSYVCIKLLCGGFDRHSYICVCVCVCMNLRIRNFNDPSTGSLLAHSKSTENSKLLEFHSVQSGISDIIRYYKYIPWVANFECKRWSCKPRPLEFPHDVWEQPKKEQLLSSSDPHPETLFWHSFWHTIRKYIIYGIFILTFYLAFFLDLSGIYSDILSGIYSDNFLAFILANILTFFLAFYIRIYSDILTGIFSGIHSGICCGIYFDSLWHSFWHTIWHLYWDSFWHSIWQFSLAFYLTFSLAGWGPAVPTEICSSSWGPQVPAEIWRPRLRSVGAHRALDLAVEAQQCPLRSGARNWARRTEEEGRRK